LSSGTDWPPLLEDYQTAVKNFESVSSALTAALAVGWPLEVAFLDRVIPTRARVFEPSEVQKTDPNIAPAENPPPRG
jgi:hypothetical protein